jgi:hypothetical protein
VKCHFFCGPIQNGFSITLHSAVPFSIYFPISTETVYLLSAVSVHVRIIFDDHSSAFQIIHYPWSLQYIYIASTLHYDHSSICQVPFFISTILYNCPLTFLMIKAVPLSYVHRITSSLSLPMITALQLPFSMITAVKNLPITLACDHNSTCQLLF